MEKKNNIALKILYLEDKEKDAELIEDLLSAEFETVELTWVKSKVEYLNALNTFKYDTILADFKLPDINGIEALHIANEICPNTPFISVSGTIGEAAAVELLTSGAADFISKDRILRLPQSIQKAVEMEEKRKEHEKDTQKIIQLNIDLEKRVLERTAQLEELNKDLEAFSQSVSHDLRAPLRTISGFTTLLLEDYGDRLDENGCNIIATIIDGITRMEKLIQGLLRLSKVVHKDLYLTKLDMIALARQVYEEIADDETKESFSFVVNHLPSVYGDKDLIYQVWSNLISNSIKYSRPVSSKNIIIGSIIDQNTVTYYVKDTGVGFNMKYVNKLFGVFSRLHSDKEFEGTGIGLANVKRVISRHGGIVWAESIINEGSTFYFKLNKCKE